MKTICLEFISVLRKYLKLYMETQSWQCYFPARMFQRNYEKSYADHVGCDEPIENLTSPRKSEALLRINQGSDPGKINFITIKYHQCSLV